MLGKYSVHKQRLLEAHCRGAFWQEQAHTKDPFDKFRNKVVTSLKVTANKNRMSKIKPAPWMKASALGHGARPSLASEKG